MGESGVRTLFFKYWKLTAAAYGLFAGALAVFLYLLPNVYTSQAMFLPIDQDDENSAVSLLSLAKAKAGLSLGGGTLNQVLLLKEILSTYAFADRFAKTLEPSERTRMFKVDPDTTIKGRAQMQAWCRKNIGLTSNAMTGVIAISASSWHQDMAPGLVAKVVGVLNDMSAGMREERLSKQLAYLQNSREKVKSDLNVKDQQLVTLERKNLGVNTPDMIYQKVKLLREQKILEETFSLLEGQILELNIKMNRDAVVLKYMERPTYPIVKDKPKRKLILLASLAGFAALHLAGLLILGNLRNFSIRR